MSALTVEETHVSEDLKKHFKENYAEKIEFYIKWQKRARLSIIAAFISFLPQTVLLLLSAYFDAKSSMFWAIPSIALAILSFGLICFAFFSDWKAKSVKVDSKNMLVYPLLEASKFYQAYVTEGKGEFLNKCLLQVEAFGESFKHLLENSEMPLRLPQIRQLEVLYEDIMNRVYPALRGLKDQPEPRGRNFDDFFLSIANLFFFEKNYAELLSIHSSISDALGDIYEPYSPEEKRGPTLLGIISRSFRTMAAISFCLITGVALVIVFLLRIPHSGTENFWRYVGDNAAEISLGILVAWASLLLILRSKYGSRD